MKQLGVPDTPEGYKMLADHLTDAARNPLNTVGGYPKNIDNVTSYFVTKESLFAGPSGKFAQFDSTWEVLSDGTLRLTTVIPKL